VYERVNMQSDDAYQDQLNRQEHAGTKEAGWWEHDCYGLVLLELYENRELQFLASSYRENWHEGSRVYMVSTSTREALNPKWQNNRVHISRT